jgi:hypothetical protein
MAHTYPNRLPLPLSRARLNPANLRRGLVMLAKIIGKLGITGDYRRVFWRLAWPALKAGKLDELIATALVAHHLITFSRGCTEQTAAFFSERVKPAAAAKQPAPLAGARPLEPVK